MRCSEKTKAIKTRKHTCTIRMLAVLSEGPAHCDRTTGGGGTGGGGLVNSALGA